MTEVAKQAVEIYILNTSTANKEASSPPVPD